ncbi:MAG: hypothetical protein U9M95_04005 [Candidatus Altiarchaeota archaeon]|nr:hypothetical protein [Candidatus Altiarchaeota archaeon]
MTDDSIEQEIEELDDEILRIEREETETFQVCPNCGSIELTAPPATKDVLSALGGSTLDGKVYCRSCGYEGLPILFDRHSINEYERFKKFRQGKLEKGEKLISENLSSDSLYEGLIPGLATLPSFFIPGFGQLYNHEPMKAILFVSLLVFILGFGLAYREYSHILILIPLVYLISVVDAHRDGERLGV